tara:strand:- start:148 stop:1380 length:1233 start_codon:yes stop_codon:yes gene_type:complete
MLFRKTLTMCAVALLAIGTSAFAQDITTPLLGLLAANDENCGKDVAKTAGCEPRDNSWLKPDMTAVKNRVKVGFGIKTSFNSNENGRTRDFGLNNARIFLSGKISDKISAFLHTDINSAQGWSFAGAGASPDGNGDGLRILDAAIDYKLFDQVSVMAGRFLPSTDRSNLSGPMFINAWEFPFVQHRNGYYDIFQGRDDGVTLYGDTGDDVQFKWSIGVFEGHNNVAGEDDVWVVGRAVLNFLDKEEGYFNQSTYYGEKEIAAIGVSFSNQDDAHAAGADYTAWSLDVLYERPLDSGGVLTAEAAYYDRDDDDDAAGFGRQGEGYFLLGSYLFSDSLSIGNLEGRLQPSIRYQESDRDDPQAGDREHQVDYSLNYIIHGHSARVSLVFQDINVAGGAEDQQNLIIGGQVRF